MSLPKTSLSNLKILHILDHSLPVHSGYAFRSHALFRAQQSMGWRPVVVTSPKHYESSGGPPLESEQIDGLLHYRTKRLARSRLPLANEFRLMVALAQRIRAVAERERPGLLHAHSPILNGIPALWESWRSGIPLVYEVRALWEDAAVDHGTYGARSWKYHSVRDLETWLCRKADRVTVICNGLRDDLVKRGVRPDKIAVVPNGVDPEVFRPHQADRLQKAEWKLDGKKVIGFLGSFFRYEGLDILLRAVARLRASRSDVALLLIGGGEMEAELKKLVAHYNLEPHVIMPGSVPQREISKIYDLIDVVVCPRHSIRLTEVVTPLKPLEAMAMGKVVVASAVGGHRELIRHGVTGVLFEAGNVDALTQALDEVLDDDALRGRLANSGRDWVCRERTWQKSALRYLDVYATLVRERAGIREKVFA